MRVLPPLRELVDRRASQAVAGLVAMRVLFALIVLARSPHRALPGLPRYVYDPTPGDAYGFYSAMRVLLETWDRDVRVLASVVLALAGLLIVAWRWTRGCESASAVRAVAGVWALGVVAAILADRVPFTGAAQIGWPLVWSVPLLPYRALGLPLDPSTAFGVGLTLSLLASAVTIVATYVLGRLVTGSTRVAVGGAALVACWPALMLLDPAGTSSHNGTWQIDLGLSLYTEPLSTALVVSSFAIVLRRRGAGPDAAIAGALLGLATLVRVSNGLIAACVVLALLVWGDRARAAAVCAAGAAFVPAVALFWPKGYPELNPPIYPAHPFELAYARTAWTESLLWHPSVLVVLLPPALVGALVIARRGSLLFGAGIVVTAVLYTFYSLTPLHPRFFFVVLPFVLLEWAAGATALATRSRRLYDRRR